jgi:hypothetical protein
MNISDEQRDAIRKVVSYSIDEERTHLEEHIATMWDDDATEMDDKMLAQYCKEKGVEHIWLELFNLSTI